MLDLRSIARSRFNSLREHHHDVLVRPILDTSRCRGDEGELRVSEKKERSHQTHVAGFLTSSTTLVARTQIRNRKYGKNQIALNADAAMVQIPR